MRLPKLRLASLCLSALFFSAHLNTAQAACSSTIYSGSVCFMAADFCPRGFVKADSTIQAVEADPALYSLLRTNFGGNEDVDFAVPDLRGRSAMGAGDTPYYSTPLTLGGKRGVLTTTLNEDQLPPHSHIYVEEDIFLSGKLKGSDSTTLTGSPAGNYLSVSAVPASKQYAGSGTTVPMAANTVTGTFDASAITETNTTGSGQAFPNQGPRLGLTACIATGTNLYPPRD